MCLYEFSNSGLILPFCNPFADCQQIPSGLVTQNKVGHQASRELMEM